MGEMYPKCVLSDVRGIVCVDFCATCHSRIVLCDVSSHMQINR
jgi:hypothetical protein